MLSAQKLNRWHWIWLLGGLLLVIVLSVSIGSVSIKPSESIKIIVCNLIGKQQWLDGTAIQTVNQTIIWQVRLPRVILAVFVGGGLAIVGTTFQGLFQNPLADPHILGVSSGAALGATIAMLTGWSLQWFGMGVVGSFAFLGALITVFIVYNLANIGGTRQVTNIVLTGTAISTLLSALISLLMTFYYDKIEKVYMWTLGSFNTSSWTKVRFCAIIVVIGSIGVFFFAKELNVIVTGEEVAQSLGINLEIVKRVLIVISSIIVAACVSVSGVIGFVGLIIPHCMRLIIGPDHRKLLPVTFLAGASFTVLCDMVARTIVAPTELPVGVITAIFGAPYFIFLLYLQNKKYKV